MRTGIIVCMLAMAINFGGCTFSINATPDNSAKYLTRDDMNANNQNIEEQINASFKGVDERIGAIEVILAPAVKKAQQRAQQRAQQGAQQGVQQP